MGLDYKLDLFEKQETHERPVFIDDPAINASQMKVLGF